MVLSLDLLLIDLLIDPDQNGFAFDPKTRVFYYVTDGPHNVLQFHAISVDSGSKLFSVPWKKGVHLGALFYDPLKAGIVGLAYGDNASDNTTLGLIKITSSRVTFTPTLNLDFTLSGLRATTKASFNAVTREVVIGYCNSYYTGLKVYSSVDIDTGVNSDPIDVDCQFNQDCFFALAPVSLN